jgi:hypothetical protein
MSKSNGIVTKCSTRTAVMSSTATTATTQAIDLTDYSVGMAWITSTAAFTGSPKVAFKVCDTETGTFVNLYTSTGGLVERALAVNRGNAMPLPYELLSAPYFKMWLQTSGTGIAQASIKQFVVCLKS